MHHDQKPAAKSAAHVSVIGAGIVGTSCALFLRLAGVPVTLYDYNRPGAGCSSGNAGMLGRDSCVPLALPGVIAKLPGMLRSSDGPLGIDAGQILTSLPWFAGFVRASRRHRVAQLSENLRHLQVHLEDSYDMLLSAADAHHLVVKRGKIHLCETETAFRESQIARDLQLAHGVNLDLLKPQEVTQLEPALTRSVYCGIHYPDVGHCLDPASMVEAMARAVIARGGKLVRDRIKDVEIGPDGPAALIGEEGVYSANRIVLAAGIGSGPLARRLGSRVPMIAHRGYNVSFPGHQLRMPVKSEDRKVILTPMAAGVRVTGIAEIARPEKPPVQRYHRLLTDHARALLHEPPEADAEAPWMGSRPCTPDSLPVIGRSTQHPSVVFAYGHGHLGLGLGPITGRIVAGLLTGAAPLVPLAPYRPDRNVLLAG